MPRESQEQREVKKRKWQRQFGAWGQIYEYYSNLQYEHLAGLDDEERKEVLIDFAKDHFPNARKRMVIVAMGGRQI